MGVKKVIFDLLTWNRAALRHRLVFSSRRIKRRIKSLGQSGNIDFTKIPVIINNRNRLTYLQELLTWLENAEMKNIIILDNDSTFPALLNFYNTIDHKIIFLNENLGSRAVWMNDQLEKLTQDYYVYTDPDVGPDENCPKDLVKLMLDELKNNFGIDKIGVGLRIDDLPDRFSLKKEVIDWEKQFWNNPVGKHFYKAPVDTTFALYSPYSKGGGECKAYRTAEPYLARHLPWYEDSANQTAEQIYYKEHAAKDFSHWTEKS